MKKLSLECVGHVVSLFSSSWSLFHTSQDLTFVSDTMRRECTWELYGAWGGESHLKCRGFHMVATEVVPVGGGVDVGKKLISIKMTSGYPQIA